MKLFFPLLALFLSALTQAQSLEGKVCSQMGPVCASYHADSPFSPHAEGRFQLHLTSLQDPGPELVKVDLWMKMGTHEHGSSPLQITPTGPLEFDITKAYFVMVGAWQIRVTYKHGSVQETLILPVVVQ
jgi:hypothetical protein